MIDADTIAAVLLAAGRSDRFGEDDKLMAKIGGAPLAEHIARRIVELSPARRIAVCPDPDGSLARALAALDFEILVNPQPARGLSSSLSIGIDTVRETCAPAALVCLADMPFVSIGHLRMLLSRFDAERAPIVASALNGQAMPPALFARSTFDRLSRIQGNQGGRHLLASAVLIETYPAELADIDTPADLARLRSN